MDKLFFYSKSRDAYPGKGTNEYIKNPEGYTQLKNIPHWCNRYKQMWNSRARECQLRFKRDHKNQKRIQCGISQKDFFKLKINFNNILIQSKWFC